MILSVKADISFTIAPENKYRNYIYNIVEHWACEVSVMTCIILNIFTMAMVYEN